MTRDVLYMHTVGTPLPLMSRVYCAQEACVRSKQRSLLKKCASEAPRRRKPTRRSRTGRLLTSLAHAIISSAILRVHRLINSPDCQSTRLPVSRSFAFSFKSSVYFIPAPVLRMRTDSSELTRPVSLSFLVAATHAAPSGHMRAPSVFAR